MLTVVAHLEVRCLGIGNAVAAEAFGPAVGGAAQGVARKAQLVVGLALAVRVAHAVGQVRAEAPAIAGLAERAVGDAVAARIAEQARLAAVRVVACAAALVADGPAVGVDLTGLAVLALAAEVADLEDPIGVDLGAVALGNIVAAEGVLAFGGAAVDVAWAARRVFEGRTVGFVPAGRREIDAEATGVARFASYGVDDAVAADLARTAVGGAAITAAVVAVVADLAQVGAKEAVTAQGDPAVPVAVVIVGEVAVVALLARCLVLEAVAAQRIQGVDAG